MAQGSLVSGRQLRAARILACLTQDQLARAAGLHRRSVVYWETDPGDLRRMTWSTRDALLSALEGHGVRLVDKPGIGVLLSGNCPP